MKRKLYDGQVGEFHYRAGATTGCFNLFLNGKFKASVTMTVLRFLQRWSKKGVSFSLADIREANRAEIAELQALRANR